MFQVVLVPLANQDCEEMLDHLDLQGLKVALAQGVILALQDLQEMLVCKDSQDQPDPVGSLDLRGSEEIQAHKDPPDHQVNRAKLDHQARRVSRACRDLQERLELLALWVYVAILGQRDWLDQEVKLDRLEQKDCLEILVNLAQPDPQVHLEHRVLWVYQVLVRLDR